MISDQITDSDAFLEMPATTRELYFQLIMKADDDGFVKNPRTIVRNVRASYDDMNILLAKKFIITFDSGVIVIKHWRIHNLIRYDRYKPTVYQEEMALLDFKENKAYTLKEIPFNLFSPEVSENESWQPNGNQMATQDKLSKVKLSKVNKDIGQIPLDELVDSETAFLSFWSMYPKKVGKDKCLRWFKAHKISKNFLNKITLSINEQAKSNQWKDIQYIPHPYTWLNRGGWDDELDQKEGKNGKDSKPVEKFNYTPRRDRKPGNDETSSSE